MGKEGSPRQKSGLQKIKLPAFYLELLFSHPIADTKVEPILNPKGIQEE